MDFYNPTNSLKTYYDILGIAKSATSAEIKKAYILRSKMMHPDRFSQTSQTAEWEMANEMLKELNQAYGVLKDPLSRNQYDYTIAGGYTSQNTYSPPPQARSYSAPKSSSSSLPGWVYSLTFLVLIGLISKGCGSEKKIAPSNLSSSSNYQKPAAPVVPRVKSPSVSLPANYPEPANGNVFKNILSSGGNGKLKISNGCTSHSFVKLIDTLENKAVYVVFIRAQSDFTISNIPNGRYKLLFAAGRGWDDVDGRFREREGASAFDQPLNFTTETRTEADGVYSYSHSMEVTLNPVVGGTAQTDSISTKEFEKY